MGGMMRIFGKFYEFKFAPAEIGNIPVNEPFALANGHLELLNYLTE